uniref:Alpha-macroglobulin receptor-binding domain-containing protein n=1 Tax=Oryzias latipes TaxID=8090 RepID=A0A3P9LWL5_ORYLA
MRNLCCSRKLSFSFFSPSSGCRTYFVTVSSRLTAGNQETLCALIQNPTEPVSLNITLDLDSSSITITEDFKIKIILVNPLASRFRCLLVLQVPIVSSETVASISVKIEGEEDSMSKDTKVLIEPPAFVHIVQTDKPIYKPGQTGECGVWDFHSSSANSVFFYLVHQTCKHVRKHQTAGKWNEALLCLWLRKGHSMANNAFVPTGDVTLKVSAEAEKSNKKCGKGVVTVPTVGQVDTVITTLLVEVSTPPPKEIKFSQPTYFVNGSERASVSVVGDLMGRAMKNLDKLLAMPYGCGEQNMLLFAPNIFILDYLKSTGQLKESTQKMAVGYLESGYQRELNYKHDDGSYSAFGMSDPSGNTWLTTFVMKSFNAAKQYIFVDQMYIKEARKWLSGLQKPDGCIQSVGKLFHNGMKGGVSDDVSLTAYVAAAMLELDGNATVSPKSIIFGLVADEITNLYTVALLSYTFTLAGDQDMRSKLFTLLDQKSTNEGGTRHWKRDGAPETDLDSVEVEMTSYVLLALLSGPSLPGFGLDYAAGIVRWLAQQQNPFGGFSSTQDTVVALQALAKYATATFSPEGSTTVTVTSVGGLNKRFTVNEDNRLLYQEEKLTEIPGEYTIEAEGQSCVLAQISLFYNIPPPSDFTHNASLDVLVLFESSAGFDSHRFQGRREETNMVVINIKLLSGYILQDNSLKMHLVVLNSHACVPVFTLQLKKGQKETFDVVLEEDQQVGNLKPAMVKVYDYYQTSTTLC